VPLFDMIRHWVFDGLLQDPGCEFFIVPNSSSTAGSSNSSSNQIPRRQQQGAVTSSSSSSVERDLWRDAYKLELAKLPPFITQELAKIIERAGKSINFLRDACGDMQWVQDWAPAAAGAAAALGYGQVRALAVGLRAPSELVAHYTEMQQPQRQPHARHVVSTLSRDSTSRRCTAQEYVHAPCLHGVCCAVLCCGYNSVSTCCPICCCCCCCCCCLLSAACAGACGGVGQPQC